MPPLFKQCQWLRLVKSVFQTSEMELSANIFNDVAINYFRKKLYIRCLIWF